jgi:hypothetical protein
MKILIFTPTYGDAMRPETPASVKAQVFAGKVKHEISKHNPFPGQNMRNVLAQYERGRARALAGDYDALLTVEHDMLLPPDALQKLWDTGAPVAYGVYLLRHGVAVLNAWELVGPRNMGESLSLHPDRLARAMRQQIVPVSGVGFGCTLIRREVLERIPFRSGGDGTEAPDMPFALDCLHSDTLQVAHFGVLCGHWDGSGWLQPFTAGASARVRANANVTVRNGQETLKMTAGQEYEIVAGEVRDLVRAGYVTALE